MTAPGTKKGLALVWPDGLRTGEVLELIDGSGVTLRQIQHWLILGAVWPQLWEADGTGDRMIWSDRDVLRLRAIGRIWKALQPLGFTGIPAQLVERVWRGLQGDVEHMVIEQGPIIIAVGIDWTGRER